ncbi:MAG: discoidin domain-containing protein [Lentisphaerae bacterium]|nr:discoidin domain-containing protein [Lentisphaerota bacterium]
MKTRIGMLTGTILTLLSIAGIVRAETLGQWMFDQVESQYVYNQVADGSEPLMTVNGTISTNMHVEGGARVESFGMMYTGTSGGNIALKTFPEIDWTTKTNMTIEMWVNPSIDGSLGSVHDPFYYRGQGLRLYFNAGFYLLGILYDGAGYHTTPFTSPKVPTNVWTHIAVTYDGAALRTYVDGTLDGTLTYAGGVNLAHAGTDFVIAANDFTGAGAAINPFHGGIDEVRISDVALLPGDGSGNGCLAWNASLVDRSAENHQPSVYADASAINLSTIQGATATQSDIYFAGSGGPLSPLHPSKARYAAFRGETTPGDPLTDANFAWWQLEMAEPFHVSHYDLYWYSASTDFYAIDFKIQTSDDGVVWTDRTTVTGNSSYTVSGDFADVTAKYIRVRVSKVNSSGTVTILYGARFTGNNSDALDNRISVSQSTWTGADIGGGWLREAEAIDDSTVDLVGANISNATPTNTPLTIVLDGKYVVDRIGISQYGVNLPQSVRNIDVYTCTEVTGTNWVLVGELRDIPRAGSGSTDPYSIHALAQTTTAVRVMFDFLSNWDNGTAQVVVEELDIFAIPPAVGTLILIQ